MFRLRVYVKHSRPVRWHRGATPLGMAVLKPANGRYCDVASRVTVRNEDAVCVETPSPVNR